MKHTEKKGKVREYLPTILLIMVAVSFVIVLWVAFLTLFSPPVQLDIANVQTETDTYVIDEVRYWDFFFDVDIMNTDEKDAIDVELVINLRVDDAIVDSHSKIIGTIQTGSEHESILSIWAVPNSQLFDTQGNYQGTITALVTLYSEGKVVDQLTTEVF